MMSKRFAIVFPGQGSQSIGMLSDLASRFPIITDTFSEASTVLQYDLWRLTQEGPDQLLNQTEYTQPALLTAGVAVWRVWQQQARGEPVVLAGHSLGEYTALVCANAIAFPHAVKLVAERGRLMQAAVLEGQGAMAAIVGLDRDQVDVLCKQAAQDEVVSSANLNAPDQVVVAGDVGAVNRVLVLAKQSGAKLAKLLAVSVPSHCALMKPAAERLAASLANLVVQTPQISIINNVDAAINVEPDAIKNALIRQLYSPVRWVEVVQAMAAMQVEVILECGPGKVLTGLNKRIVPSLPAMPLYNVETFEQALAISD